jgi:hypothetical protein
LTAAWAIAREYPRVSFVENAQGIPGDAEEWLRDSALRLSASAHALSHYE